MRMEKDRDASGHSFKDVSNFSFEVQENFWKSTLNEQLGLGRGAKVDDETKQFIFDLARAGLGSTAITTIVEVVRKSSAISNNKP